MRYILNAAVLTSPGLYNYKLLSLDDVSAWLKQPGWESHLRYQEMSEALLVMTGYDVPVDRKPARMAAGDEALIVRLTVVLEPRTSRYFDRRQLASIDWLQQNTEMGLLRRLE